MEFKLLSKDRIEGIHAGDLLILDGGVYMVMYLIGQSTYTICKLVDGFVYLDVAQPTIEQLIYHIENVVGYQILEHIPSNKVVLTRR